MTVSALPTALPTAACVHLREQPKRTPPWTTLALDASDQQIRRASAEQNVMHSRQTRGTAMTCALCPSACRTFWPPYSGAFTLANQNVIVEPPKNPFMLTR
jgi:hypothetical protein